MDLKTYVKTVENVNRLARRAGIHPSVLYRALAGADIKLSTALKIVGASDYRIDLASLASSDESSAPSTADLAVASSSSNTRERHHG